jgi:YVTN family beta-propeller protein
LAKPKNSDTEQETVGFGTINLMAKSRFFLLLAGALCGAFGDDRDAMVPIETAADASIRLDGFPDWLELGFGSLWVSNPGRGAVQRIDPDTNKLVAEVKVKDPCAAMASGYGSIWVASCKDESIYRIDPKRNQVIAKIPARLADSEASLAAGEGSIWALTNRDGELSRISPDTNEIVARIKVKSHSYAAAVGYGAVWVTNTGEPRSTGSGSVQRIDPKSNTVTATIAVGSQPRFLAAEEAGVWVLNQADGTVSRIDPKTNQVVATIHVGVPGPGGDIAAGEGAVWVRANKVLLSAIDPTTNKVARRYGPPQGSGAVRAGGGKVWVSAHDVNKVWRLTGLAAQQAKSSRGSK